MSAYKIRMNPFGALATRADDLVVEKEYAHSGGWEVSLVTFLRERAFPEGKGTLIDVGAHVGLVSVPVALRHPKVTVHAFEPHPGNFEGLKYNVELNHVQAQMRLHQCAVGEEDGVARFFPSPENTVDGRVEGASAQDVRHHPLPGRYGEEHREGHTVILSTLDRVLAALPLERPIVVKLDVQGQECAVLRGAQDLIKRVDALLIEVWPYGLARAGETMESLAGLLRWRFSKFAPMLAPEVVPQPDTAENGLLLSLLRCLPWNGETAGYFDLVCLK